MKLRNKKTGEIKEDSDLSKMLSRYDMPSFESISELCDEWEDYAPKEPLIKDEKVRKAIRAFAELHDSKTITFDETHSGASFISRADNGYSMLWILGKSWGAENIEYNKPYTIAELCGEEE